VTQFKGYPKRAPKVLDVAIQEILSGTRTKNWVDFQDDALFLNWMAVVGTKDKFSKFGKSLLVRILVKELIKSRCSVCNRKFTDDDVIVLRLALYDEVYYALSQLEDGFPNKEEAVREVIRCAPFAPYPNWEYSVVHREFCNEIRTLRDVL
jgi:hypothetical protein